MANSHQDPRWQPPRRTPRAAPPRQALLLGWAVLLTAAGGILLTAADGLWAQGTDPVIVEDDSPPDRPILALDTGGHTNGVYKLLATHYAEQLISVGLDKTIRFWDLDTGEPLRVLRPPIARGAFGYLFAAAISPDGKMLAVGGYRAHTPLYDHRIHLIALPEGQIVHSLKGHKYAVYDLAFSSDGRQLASASHDGTLRVWDTASGDTTRVLEGHTAVVHAVAWSPDDKYLVSGSIDKTGRIWSAASGATVAVLREHAAEVMTVAWSPDGRLIATGCHDKSVRLFEPSGKRRYVWPNLPNEVTSVAFSPDSKRLLYTYGSNAQPPVGAAVLDMVDGRERARYQSHENSVLCGVFVHGGQQVATGDSVSGIRLWDAASGQTVHRLEGQGKSVISVGWSPDGQAVAWGHSTKDATINYGGRLERTFCFRLLDFGPPPDKTFLRAQTQLGTLQIGLGTDSGRHNRRKVGVARSGALLSMFTLPQAYDQVRCFSLLAGSRAAVGTSGGAYVIDVQTAQIQMQLMDRGEDIWGLAASADFRYLLTAGNDQIVKVWNLATGLPIVSLFVAGDEWVAWTPEGYYAASLAGEALMGWHINQGPTQMAAYYPASQFHKSLYRPDVIRRLLAAGDVYRALELADEEQTLHSRKLVVSDVLPPQVTITAPAEGSIAWQAGEMSVEASATPADEDPITALRLIVDGRPFGPSQAVTPNLDQPAAVARHEWTLSLPRGDHQVVVKAETAESYGLSRPLVVAPGPAEGNPDAQPGDASTPPGKLYVLAIGAAPEAPSGTPSIQARDASALAAALRTAGARQFEAVIARSLADAEASPAAILQALETFKSEMTLADTAVIYFAGRSALTAQGELAFGSGGKPGPAESSGELTAAQLETRLAALPGHLVLVLDAMQTSSAGSADAHTGFCGSTPEPAGTPPVAAVAADWVRKLLTEDYGVVVIGGSRRPIADKSGGGGSALVQALIEALEGSADADGDRIVELHELAPFVSERAGQLSGSRQSLVVERPHGMHTFPLGKSAVSRPEPPPAAGQPAVELPAPPARSAPAGRTAPNPAPKGAAAAAKRSGAARPGPATSGPAPADPVPSVTAPSGREF